MRHFWVKRTVLSYTERWRKYLLFILIERCSVRSYYHFYEKIKGSVGEHKVLLCGFFYKALGGFTPDSLSESMDDDCFSNYCLELSFSGLYCHQQKPFLSKARPEAWGSPLVVNIITFSSFQFYETAKEKLPFICEAFVRINREIIWVQGFERHLSWCCKESRGPDSLKDLIW